MRPQPRAAPAKCPGSAPRPPARRLLSALLPLEADGLTHLKRVRKLEGAPQLPPRRPAAQSVTRLPRRRPQATTGAWSSFWRRLPAPVRRQTPRALGGSRRPAVLPPALPGCWGCAATRGLRGCLRARLLTASGCTSGRLCGPSRCASDLWSPRCWRRARRPAWRAASSWRCRTSAPKTQPARAAARCSWIRVLARCMPSLAPSLCVPPPGAAPRRPASLWTTQRCVRSRSLLRKVRSRLLRRRSCAVFLTLRSRFAWRAAGNAAEHTFCIGGGWREHWRSCGGAGR